MTLSIKKHAAATGVAFGLVATTVLVAPAAHASAPRPIDMVCDAVPPTDDPHGTGPAEFCEEPGVWAAYLVGRICDAGCQDDVQTLYCRVSQRLDSPCE